MVVSAKRIAVVDLVAGQSIRRAKGAAAGPEAGPEFVLLPFEAVEFGFLLRQGGEEALHESRNRGFFLRGEDGGAMVGVVIHRNCDVLHEFTLTAAAIKSRIKNERY